MFTIGDITRKRARLGADTEALVFGARRTTYGVLHRRTNRLANALLALGLPQGARVAILAENSDRYMELLLAVAKAGMVSVPLNFRLSPGELSHLLKDSGATALFADAHFVDPARALRKEVPEVGALFSLGEGFADCPGYEDFHAGGAEGDPAVQVGENELASLIYTGGTTGLPKGVMLSHRNWLSGFVSINVALGINQSDTTLFFLPMFHVAVWQVFCHLIAGARVVVLPRPDLKQIMQTIETERCTNLNAVPTLFNWIVDHPELDQYDLSSIRFLAYSGSPFPEATLRKCIERFGPIFHQGYGLTEAAPIVSFLGAQDHVLEGPRARLLQSAGRETIFTEVCIGDADGNPVPRGMPGEVMARGPNIMLGYWHNEALTRERLRDGWLYTGDIGLMDEDGYIFLLDRKADMIVTGGENVYPAEVEGVLLHHPAVQECVVASAPDAHWGERVQAAVVLRPDALASAQELIEFCKERLAGYKCPKQIEFVAELPKSPVGKLLRRQVKDRFWYGQQKKIA